MDYDSNLQGALRQRKRRRRDLPVLAHQSVAEWTLGTGPAGSFSIIATRFSFLPFNPFLDAGAPHWSDFLGSENYNAGTPC
jgi:hypothetical protein